MKTAVLKKIALSVIFFLAVLTAGFCQRTTVYALEIGYSSYTARRYGSAERSPLGTGFTMNCGSAYMPEVWAGYGPGEFSVYVDNKRISEYTSCGFWGFKLGLRLDRYISFGAVFDSGVGIYGKASKKNLVRTERDIEEGRSYDEKMRDQLFPHSVYKNRTPGAGTYLRLQYPIKHRWSETCTIAPFISAQAVTNGNNCISFGLMFCLLDGYKW